MCREWSARISKMASQASSNCAAMGVGTVASKEWLLLSSNASRMQGKLDSLCSSLGGDCKCHHFTMSCS